MKKFLLFALGTFLTFGALGQTKKVQEAKTLMFTNDALKAKQAKNDTILPRFYCINPSPTFYPDINNSIITGTYKYNDTTTFIEVGQLLNEQGDTLDIYSLLAITIYKEEGPSKGSFTAAIHDTTNGISSAPIATSNPISFDNINDTSSTTLINEFTFSSPVRVDAPFWAMMDVDNGSDTISFASTVANCGANSIFLTSNGNYRYFSNAFSIGENKDPLLIALHIWATVDTNVVGLDHNFLSRKGLKFYPNPASDIATIEFDLPSENTLQLVVQDMTGREVYRTEKTFNGGESEFKLDVSGFENGTYTYQIVGEKTQLNGVFVKQ